MNLKRTLNNLMRVVVEEADRNPDFAKRLEDAVSHKMAKAVSTVEKQHQLVPSRPSHRRPPAILDPVEVVRNGEQALRSRLNELTLEQLKDIVADYGMDPGKLVLKWKTSERIIDRIIEVSLSRARKGEGFLSSGRSS